MQQGMWAPARSPLRADSPECPQLHRLPPGLCQPAEGASQCRGPRCPWLGLFLRGALQLLSVGLVARQTCPGLCSRVCGWRPVAGGGAGSGGYGRGPALPGVRGLGGCSGEQRWSWPVCAPRSPQPPPPAGPAAEAASWAPGRSASSPGCVLLRCTRDTPGCYLTAPGSPDFSLVGLLSDDAGKRQEDPQDLRGQVGQSPRHREGGPLLGSHSTAEEVESSLSSSVTPHAVGRPAPAQPRPVLLMPALPTLPASSRSLSAQSCSAHPSPAWQCPG